MTIYFRDDSAADYTPPAHTGDPRYKACTDHRPACDCREAWLNEELTEYRGEYLRMRKAIDEVLADHEAFDEDMQPRCRCTGCQIRQRAFEIEDAEWRAQTRPAAEEGVPF